MLDCFSGASSITDGSDFEYVEENQDVQGKTHSMLLYVALNDNSFKS